MSFIKVNKVQHLGSSGDGLVIDDKGTVGIATNNIETNTALVGTANSMTGHIFYSFGTLKLNLKSYGDYVPLFFTETLFVENSLFLTAPLLFLFLYFAAFYFSSFF